MGFEVKTAQVKRLHFSIGMPSSSGFIWYTDVTVVGIYACGD